MSAQDGFHLEGSRTQLCSEIRESVASTAKTTALRARSCDSCPRGHTRLSPTAVHVLDNAAVFGAVSDSAAVKCHGGELH